MHLTAAVARVDQVAQVKMLLCTTGIYLGVHVGAESHQVSLKGGSHMRVRCVHTCMRTWSAMVYPFVQPMLRCAGKYY